MNMRYIDCYNRVIAISERSCGNEQVGDMWFETKSFDKETPISKIIEWGRNTNGKLIITIDEDSKEVK